ncbi:hypothetical protein AB1N83_008831 [Pleurotus pulmonarius]
MSLLLLTPFYYSLLPLTPFLEASLRFANRHWITLESPIYFLPTRIPDPCVFTYSETSRTTTEYHWTLIYMHVFRIE